MKDNKYGYNEEQLAIINQLKVIEHAKEVEREYIILLSKYDSNMINKIISMTDCSIFGVEEYIKDVQFTKEGMYLFDQSSLSNLYCGDSYDESSIDKITSIKSQLKHCKNPLQKLNLEREMNRLIREGRK